jgi:hypothetical protein
MTSSFCAPTIHDFWSLWYSLPRINTQPRFHRMPCITKIKRLKDLVSHRPEKRRDLAATRPAT